VAEELATAEIGVWIGRWCRGRGVDHTASVTSRFRQPPVAVLLRDLDRKTGL
jgi:hypothetical protein